MKLTCKQCGKEFDIPQADVVELVSANKPIPQLCPACRGVSEEEKPAQKASKGGLQFKTPYGGDDDSFDPSTLQSEERRFHRPSQKVAVIVALCIAVVAMVVFSVVFTRTEHRSHRFLNREALLASYDVNGIAMGFDDADVYEKAASDIINDRAAIKKKSKETGQTIYYLESTNEVVLVQDGHIVSYFRPEEGKDYLETVH